MIKALILADSVNPYGSRITTWQLTYPRFMHAEFMTHRDFSRNSASSRAIPLKNTIAALRDEPALPVWWGSHLKGMQSGAQLTGTALQTAQDQSHRVMTLAMFAADEADRAGLHKSLTNRWLEPWSHITVIATATDHRNFFALRANSAALPEFQVLAYSMLSRYVLARPPVELNEGDWHIPYGDDKNIFHLSAEDRVRVATARCCWVSYNRPDKIIGEETSIDDAFARHDESVKVGHWSPFEHCAKVVNPQKFYPRSNFDTDPYDRSGWLQYRKTFNQERKTAVNLAKILEECPQWVRDSMACEGRGRSIQA